MPRANRFHLDENVDPRVAAGLRLLGADVTTTADAGLIAPRTTNNSTTSSVRAG